jgi:hypothetical protein
VLAVGARRWLGATSLRWARALHSLELPFTVGLSQVVLTAGVIVVFLHVVAFATVVPGATGGFAAWDGRLYLDLAAHGYREPFEAALFPAYPMAIKAVHTVTRLSYLDSALLISNLAFMLALVLLYKLVRNLYGAGTAGRAVWLIAVFPTSFYFSVAYTESLNLLAMVAFFYLLQQRRWYPAMLAGAGAALTHDIGVLLILPALWEWWHRERVRGTIVPSGRPLLRLLSTAIIPMGLVAFVAYTALLFHDPMAILTAHSSHWGRAPVFPVVSIFQSLLDINLHPAAGFDTNLQFMALVNGLATLLVVALTVGALIRRGTLPGAMLVTLVTMLLASIVTGTIINLPPVWSTVSYARAMVVLFPAFIVLAKVLTRPQLFVAVIVLSVALKALLAGMFGDGYWVV